MVKAYLRYRAEDSFGLVASPTCNVAAHPEEGLVFASANEVVLAWDAVEGTLSNKFVCPADAVASVTRLHVSLSNPSDLIAAYADGKIRIWDTTTATQNIKCTFNGHKAAINALTQSLNGEYLASGGNDHEIVIWDTYNNEGRFRLTGHTQPISGLAFLYEKESETETETVLRTSPKYLVSGSLDGMLKVWDLEQQTCVQSISTHSTASVQSLLLTPSQNHLIVGLAGTNLEVFEVQTNKGDGDAGTHTLVFSGVLTRAEGTRKVADLTFMGQPKRQPSEVGEYRLLADGTYLSGDKRRVCVVDQEGVIVVSAFNQSLEVVQSLDRKGRRSREFRMLLRRIEKLKRRRNKLEAGSQIDKELSALLGSSWRSTQASMEQSQLASIEKGLEILRSALATKKVKDNKRAIDDDDEGEMDLLAPINSAAMHFRMLPTRFDLVAKSIFLAAGQSSATTGTLFVSTATNTIEKYTLDKAAFFTKSIDDDDFSLLQATATGRTVIGIFDSLPESPTSIAVSNDDKSLITLCTGSVDIWDIVSKKCRLRLNSKTTSVKKSFKPLAAIFLAGDEHIVVGDSEGEISIFNIPTATRVHREIEAHETAIQQLATSPDHTKIASVGGDKKLKVWGLELDSETADLSMSELLSVDLPDKAADVKYTFDGRMIGVALQDHTCLLFYADTLKLHLTFYGHTLPLTSLAFSTDGQFMATGSIDKHVKIWDTEFGNILRSLSIGREGFVTGVRFVFDTHYLICACSDGVVRLYDCDTGDRITNLTAGACSFRGLATTGDAELILCAASDRSIKVWARTDEQLFLIEEREREEGQSVRADLSLPGAASRQVVMDSRATKRDIEAVRCIERLVQLVDQATQEEANQKGYQEAFKQWSENAFRASLPKPPKPTPLLELMGRSPQQHIAAGLLTLPTETQTEILLGIPQKTALKILEFSTNSLQGVAELIEKESDLAPLMMRSAETSLKVCLTLIHSHKRFLASLQTEEAWMIKLNRAIKRILDFDLALNRRNAIALSFLANQSQLSRPIEKTLST